MVVASIPFSRNSAMAASCTRRRVSSPFGVLVDLNMFNTVDAAGRGVKGFVERVQVRL
jgi:hypothetical protein